MTGPAGTTAVVTNPQTDLTAAELSWVVLALALGGGPHLPNISAWIGLIFAAACVWRLCAAVRAWRPPPIWVRAPLTLACFAGVMFTYHSISGVEAGSALLLAMSAMKILETRTNRDRILLITLSYFLLFAVFLWEQAIWSAAWLIGACVGITAALAQTVRRDQALAPIAAVMLSGHLLARAVPLAVVLFVLFPRIPGPFWSLPKPAGTATTGLSEVLNPGDISALSRSDAVAFRVRFDGRPPPEELLYWRGPVLDWFDGRAWRVRTPATPSWLPAQDQRGRAAGEIDYEVVLEPSNQRWLLALETPVHWSGARASVTVNRQLITMEPIIERLAYRARSQIDSARSVGRANGPANIEPSSQALTAALSLPAGSNPRASGLAARLRLANPDDRSYLESVLRMFHDEPFQYTLTPPRLGRQAVDDFLFATRQGFCEHYASAFAFLARAGGLPARVVAGYQGAERNPFSDYWIIRQANAHAWVEVWLDGAWRRYDPTAAVAPERITDGLASEILRSRLGDERLWRTNLFLNRVVLSWDAVNAAWDRWVLAFGPDTQTELLLRLGFTTPDPMQLLALCLIAAMCCVLALTLAMRRQFRVGADRVSRTYAKACERVGRVTRPRRGSESPESYARIVQQLRPDLAQEMDSITGIYLRLRYMPWTDPALERDIERRVRRFRPGQRPDHAPATTAMHPQQTGRE